MNRITPEQCRAARVSGLEADRLSCLHRSTIGDERAFEAGGTMLAANQKLLKMVLFNAGIMFDHNESGRQTVTFNPALKARFLDESSVG